MSHESVPEPLSRPVERAGGDARRRTGWSTAAVAATVVYCWVVAGFGSFTLASNVAILGAGLATLVVAFACPPPRLETTKPLTRLGIGVWVAILGVFAVQEITDDVLGSKPAHPTLSVLMDPVLDHQVVRAIAIGIWLKVGWTLVRR